MHGRATRRRRRALSSGLQARMVRLFVTAVLGSVGAMTLGVVGFYVIGYGAGPNHLREFVVVYRQHPQTESVTIDGRNVDRRSYMTEARPQTSRLAIVLPPLIVNNVIIAIVLLWFAIRYTTRVAGPVYRMSADIRRALAGEGSVRISLRKGDEMRELAQRVNALLEALELAEARARDE